MTRRELIQFKQKSRNIVNHAIKTGRITKPSSCSDCGQPGKVQAHHPDHADPLHVEWLCVPCHSKRHPVYGNT